MYSPPLSASFFIDPTPNERDEFADDEPSDMLYCHLCRKNMRDVTSFENHIKSRPHLLMCETIEESYLHKVEMLRQVAHIDEQLNAIQMNGRISAYRFSECPSQKLLQPKCVECNLEFCTRSDYDSHLLTAHAIIKTAEKNIQVGESQLQGDEPSPSKKIKITEDEDAEVENERQKDGEKAVTEAEVIDKVNVEADEAQGGEGLTETKKPEEEVVVSAYANVPNDVFYCHQCNLRMWDAITFQNHLFQRSHLVMREDTAEGYRLKANIIRLKAKRIELGQLKNRNKHCAQKFCGLCDLHYHGRYSVHRKTEGHLQLKKLFYPKCRVCNVRFNHRLEYDRHLLSPEHLTEIAERNIKIGELEI